jgi:hypothetical protein
MVQTPYSEEHEPSTPRPTTSGPSVHIWSRCFGFVRRKAPGVNRSCGSGQRRESGSLPRGGAAEVAADAADGVAVEDVGHVGEAAAAAWALDGGDLEAAAHQLGPRGVGAERCTG